MTAAEYKAAIGVNTFGAGLQFTFLCLFAYQQFVLGMMITVIFGAYHTDRVITLIKEYLRPTRKKDG